MDLTKLGVPMEIQQAYRNLRLDESKTYVPNEKIYLLADLESIEDVNRMEELSCKIFYPDAKEIVLDAPFCKREVGDREYTEYLLPNGCNLRVSTNRKF